MNVRVLRAREKSDSDFRLILVLVHTAERRTLVRGEHAEPVRIRGGAAHIRKSRARALDFSRDSFFIVDFFRRLIGMAGVRARARACTAIKHKANAMIHAR